MRRTKEYNKAYDCPYCKLMKRKPVWNPFRDASPFVDPRSSLNSHIGICQVKFSAIDKAKKMREEILCKQVNPPQEHDRHMIMPLIHHHESNKRSRNKVNEMLSK